MPHSAPDSSNPAPAIARGGGRRWTAEKAVASACVLGVNCRYDGSSRPSPDLLARLSEMTFIPICPEQLGGLPTPRAPCNIESGTGADVLAGRARVVDESGADKTAEFVRGAKEAAEIAKTFGATRAFLKSRSPSCDASFGVAAAALSEAGIAVESVD